MVSLTIDDRVDESTHLMDSIVIELVVCFGVEFESLESFLEV